MAPLLQGSQPWTDKFRPKQMKDVAHQDEVVRLLVYCRFLLTNTVIVSLLYSVLTCSSMGRLVPENPPPLLRFPSTLRVLLCSSIVMVFEDVVKLCFVVQSPFYKISRIFCIEGKLAGELNASYQELGRLLLKASVICLFDNETLQSKIINSNVQTIALAGYNIKCAI